MSVCICVTWSYIFCCLEKRETPGVCPAFSMVSLSRKRHIFCSSGVQSASFLALSFSATVPEYPRKTKCFCGVRSAILSKFCLLVDLRTRTLGCWDCRIPPLECPYDPLLGIRWDFRPLCCRNQPLEKFQAAENGFCAIWQPLLLLWAAEGAAPVTSRTAHIWGMQRKTSPQGQFPLLFPCVTRPKPFTRH